MTTLRRIVRKALPELPTCGRTPVVSKDGEAAGQSMKNRFREDAVEQKKGEDFYPRQSHQDVFEKMKLEQEEYTKKLYAMKVENAGRTEKVVGFLDDVLEEMKEFDEDLEGEETEISDVKIVDVEVAVANDEMKRDIGCYGKKDSTITVVDANVNVIESENDLISLNPSPALSKQNSRVIAFMNQILEETRKSDDHDTLVDELSIRDVKTSIDVTEIGRLSGKKMEESDGKKGVNGKKKISGVGYMNPTKSSAGKTVVLKKKGSGVLELPKMPVTVKFAKSKNSLESVTPCAEKTVKRCVKNAKSPKNPFEKVAPCAEKTAKNFLKNAKSSKTPLDAEKTAKKFVKNAALNIDSDAIELDRLDTVIAGYDFSRFKYDADSVLIDGHGKHVDGKDDNMKTSLSDANRFDLKDVPTDCVNDETVKTCLSDADRFNVKTDRPATINGERILNGYKTSLDSVYVKPSQLQWHDEKVKTFMSDASRLYTEDVMLSSGVAITFLRVIMSSVTCDDLMDEIPPFSVRCGDRSVMVLDAEKRFCSVLMVQ